MVNSNGLLLALNSSLNMSKRVCKYLLIHTSSTCTSNITIIPTLSLFTWMDVYYVVTLIRRGVFDHTDGVVGFWVTLCNLLLSGSHWYNPRSLHGKRHIVCVHLRCYFVIFCHVTYAHIVHVNILWRSFGWVIHGLVVCLWWCIVIEMSCLVSCVTEISQVRHVLKALCHSCPVDIIDIANYASLSAVDLDIMSKSHLEHYIKCYKQQNWTLKKW